MNRAGPTWRTCTAASPSAPASASARSARAPRTSITAVADAFLDRSPLVALTGQGDLERMHKESHQYIDIVSIMKPMTKWNARLNSPADHPRGGAQGVQGRAGPEARPDPHRAARGRDGGDARRRAAARRGRRSAAPSRRRPSCSRRSRSSARPINPIVLAGNGVARVGAAAGAARVRARHRHRRGRDVHGQGPARLRGPALARHRRAAVARLRAGGLRGRRRRHHRRLRPRRALPGALEPQEQQEDRLHRHDLGRGRRVLHARGRPRRRHLPHPHPPGRGAARRAARRARTRGSTTSSSGASSRRKDDDSFPMQPPRALWEIRNALGREDILVSDVGLHKLWIARMFPAHEPNTVFIANGLAGMGIALPTAIAAKLVHPERKVDHGQRRRRLPHELPGAGDRRAPEDADRQRDLGELAVRLDRLEAGQEVRPPLRRRLHQPRLRQARRRVRHAGAGGARRPTTSAATCATR